MDKLLVTVFGLGAIGFIYWFFFGKNEEASTQTHVLVNGGYMPSTIKIPVGKSTTLMFTRTDANTCLEDFYIPDFKIKKYFPMNTPVTVTLLPPTRGTFGFHCGMNMFHGKIEVV